VEEIDSNGIKRYRMVAQGQQEETTTTGNSTKKRPPTLSNSHPNPIAVNSSVDVSKKQKV
jgi:hypothetical protein